jgi:hypothetical protein
VIRTSEMLKKARAEAEKNNYSVFGGATSTTVKKCPECGKPSLVGCISEDKEWIISFCFYRFYIGNKNLKCTYNKKWANRKVEEDRESSAPNTGV